MAYQYNRRYGGALSFTQGFLDAFVEYQKMRYMMGQDEINNQYRRSLMQQHERSAEKDALTMPWLKARAATAEKTLRGEPLTPGEATLFGRSTTINMMERPRTPGTIKSMRDLISDNLWSSFDKDKNAFTESGITDAIERSKKQLQNTGEYQNEQFDATVQGEIEAVRGFAKEKGYEFQYPPGQWEKTKKPEGWLTQTFQRGFQKWKGSIFGLPYRKLTGQEKPSEPGKTESKELTNLERSDVMSAVNMGKGPFIPDDTRLYAEPDWMGRQSGWMKLPEDLRKQTWITPKDEREFINTLKELQLKDYNIAKKYYERYLDRFY